MLYEIASSAVKTLDSTKIYGSTLDTGLVNVLALITYIRKRKFISELCFGGVYFRTTAVKKREKLKALMESEAWSFARVTIVVLCSTL